MKRNAKKVIILIGIVVAVGIIGFSIKNFLQKEFSDGPVQEDNQKGIITEDIKYNVSNSIDLSKWKTYRSEEYGFEVKYPEGWVVDDEFEKGIITFSDEKTYAENHPGFTVMTVQVSPGGGYGLEGFDLLEKKDVYIGKNKAMYYKYMAGKELIKDINKNNPSLIDFYKNYMEIGIYPLDMEDTIISFGGDKDKASYFDAFLKTLKFDD